MSVGLGTRLDANAGPLDGLTFEMILDAADPCEQSTVTVASRGASVGPNPKRHKLSLSSQKKPMFSESAVRIHIPVPLGEVTNHVQRFAAPVTSPVREKAARGVLPANTEASTR